jgi:hypothetical protein
VHNNGATSKLAAKIVLTRCQTRGSSQTVAAPAHTARVFNDLIDDFTKSDFKSFWDDFEIFKITLKYGDLI